ncbi:lanthionine synthetase LanC family protein [Archangium violaceum]|uniref:lanthionine synthetase LanC family protein n=1 Tax=Archangium violaceum TaxID=83451 RepID=UPI002B29E120|nr:lanthionine synthetase LanC family protein [Archangium gephyra]
MQRQGPLPPVTAPGASMGEARPAESRTPAALLERRLLLQVGAMVANQLAAKAVELEGGGVVWHGEAWKAANATGAPRGFQPDGVHDIYGGVLGVALFLAAQARVGGDERARDLALRALAPMRLRARQALRGDTHALPALGVGGLVGLGSLIYGLAVLGRLLDSPELAEEAHALTALVTPERLTGDREYDVVHGCAGAVLSLLSLGPAVHTPNAAGRTPLELAWLAAEHLLAQRTAAGDEPLSWVSASAGMARSGMAHGVAGICVALARLWQHRGGEPLLQAISEGLLFEQRLFDTAGGNWMTSLTGPGKSLLGWCQGAPGMALSRLALVETGVPVGIEKLAREDMERALATLRSAPPFPLDHLCCGGMGWVEVLLRIWQHTGEPGLLERAHVLAHWVLRAAKARGTFQLGSTEPFEPSFFQGLAGVGYAFLRLAEPRVLPCLLLLE